MKQGWEIKKLSEIGKVFNGNSINEKVKKEKYTGLDDGLPFIATKDVSFDSEIDYENGVRIPLNEINQFKIAPSNTPLICAEGGSAGRKIGFTNQDVCFGNKLFALVPNKNADSKYVYYYYFTSSFQKHFSTEMAGIIGGVSMNKFKDIEIPLPPLPEQQRIVSILDEAFAAIAKAKANAEQNLKNAKELFESYLQGMFENGNWETKKLSEVAKHSLGKMLDKNKNKGEPKEYLRNQNVRWFEFDLSDLNEMPFLENEKEKYTAIKGDVMICEGGYPGRAAIWEEDYPIYFQKAIHRVRFHDEEYNKWFLFYLFILDKTGKLKNHFTGTGIQHFTGDALGKLILPFPPLDKVKTIVRQLDALRAETQKLEAVYQKKIDDLEELKKSILQKAFAGELRSPEGAEYKSEVATPLADKKPNTITSPEGV